MRRRIKEKEGNPWDALKGIVRPGEQPFDFNALTLAHAWLVAVPLPD